MHKENGGQVDQNNNACIQHDHTEGCGGGTQGKVHDSHFAWHLVHGRVQAAGRERGAVLPAVEGQARFGVGARGRQQLVAVERARGQNARQPHLELKGEQRNQ